MSEEILELIDQYVDVESETLCMLYERKIYAANSEELRRAKEYTEKENRGEEEFKQQSGIDVKHYEVKKTSDNNNSMNNNHNALNFQDYLNKCGYTIVQELTNSKKIR